ncbi:MAG: sigma-54 dependent transcriptional regulator, partial [Bdellovibrionota bacterium]
KLNSEAILRSSSFAGIVSECPRMNKVFAVIEKVAKTNSTVLILGESGTGKELIARALHNHSGRRGKLVPVNCGAIPEDILESELFGHEKGAFTGAVANKIGRFQHADGGTIFLDEIAEMSPKLQVKLLRVLQERKVEPVGSTRSIPVDVRIVAATNKDLREEVKAGRFREDLYYRLQVVPVALPALRTRGADVSLLASYFLMRVCEDHSFEPMSFSPEALAKLIAYSWPGNVRELENLIERLAILSDGSEIQLAELPEYILGHKQESTILELNEYLPEEGISFNSLVDEFESKLIMMALDKTGWNKKAAAELLNLNRTTLVEKIKKKGLSQQVEVIREDETARPF